MKRWLVTAVLGAVGCQSGSSATATQEVAAEDCYGVANFCGATAPAPSPWLPGDPLPQSTPNTVVMLMTKSSSVWQAFGADPVLGQVVWTRTVKSSAIGAFMVTITSANRPYGGVRPPPIDKCPPNCIIPGLVLAAALRVSQVQASAEADINACPQ